jgi:microfibrillar-associated protein 1
MARLTRDAEEREEVFIEKAELMRRRNMTDEERLEEDRKLGLLKESSASDKPKWGFMQKYYHKGVFYMDSTSLKKDDDVRNKDYAAEPTLTDKVDKEKLPAVMQVKNFGKRGRTKYTHLLDQDTTVSKGPEKKRMDVRPAEHLMNKYLDKRSGVGKL